MESQRVAVVGAGAVGCYYGARLAQAGHDLRFLLRRDYEAVRAGGLRVRSPDGDFTLAAPAIARTPAELGAADWVICALKSTSMDAVADLIHPCLQPGTRILALMNGLGLEQQFARCFPNHPIFGGMAFTCINRGEPGEIQHLRYGPVTVGHLGDEAAELEAARALWRGATVAISVAPSLLQARWEKLCWNIPFNGLAVAGGGITTDRIVGDPGLRAIARRAMEEVIASGNADLAAGGETARLDREAMLSRMFALTDAMGVYRPSTMIDFVEGRPMEVEWIFARPARRAAELGVDAPLMAAFAALLGSLDRR